MHVCPSVTHNYQYYQWPISPVNEAEVRTEEQSLRQPAPKIEAWSLQATFPTFEIHLELLHEWFKHQERLFRLKAYNYIYFYNHEMSVSHSEVANFISSLRVVKAALLSVLTLPHLISWFSWTPRSLKHASLRHIQSRQTLNVWKY